MNHGQKAGTLIQSNRRQRNAASLSLATFCALNAQAVTAWGETHPSGVPVLNSRAGAPYTIYLDFAGFNYNGTWGGSTPGNTGAINGATGSFTTAQQQIIANTWAGIADKYSVYNGINVTTVDPAPSGDTDAQRQAYYDSQPMMMHTILGDNNNWASAGGISFVGVTPYSYPATGYHTNWVFVDGTGGDTSYHGSCNAGAHENGHGFGLSHQSDYDPATSTDVSDYSTNNNASGIGSFAPIMGVTYSSQRSLWRIGYIGNGTIQNDAQTIVNDPGMTGFVADGIGHALASATSMPISGTAVNSSLAAGVIVPVSTSSPQALGVSSYTTDYFKFSSVGGPISLTLHDGGQWVTPGVAGADPMFRGTMLLLDSSGNVLYTSTDSTDTLSSTISHTLAAGTYYAEVESTGNKTGTYVAPSNTVVTSSFFDMGSFFLTGSGFVTASNYYWAGTLSGNWTTVSSGASNWRNAITGGSDPGAGPNAGSSVFFTVGSGASNLTTTLGASTTINSLNFTGVNTSAGSSSVTIAADGSTLTLAAGASFNDSTGSTYPAGTGLTVASGSAAHFIAVPVALSQSQTWAINNNQSNPLTVSGIISGSGFNLNVIGGGKLVLSGNNTYSGGTNISVGVVTAAASLALGTGPVSLNGGTLQLQGATGPVQVSNGVFVSAGKTASINLAALVGHSTGGVGAINIATGSVLSLTNIGYRALLISPSVAAAGSGKLDIGNNDLDLTSTTLAQVNALVASGYQQSWTGSGITSNSAALDSRHLTAVGVIRNNQSGAALYTAAHQFDGATPGASDILVKYSYYGDANLDGKVDGTDYTRIDNGYLTHATGWFNGDFNYDSVIDGSDYTLVDNAYNTQGAQFSALISNPATDAAEIAGISAVPEPVNFGIFGFAGAVLIGRRKRKFYRNQLENIRA